MIHQCPAWSWYNQYWFVPAFCAVTSFLCLQPQSVKLSLIATKQHSAVAHSLWFHLQISSAMSTKCVHNVAIYLTPKDVMDIKCVQGRRWRVFQDTFSAISLSGLGRQITEMPFGIIEVCVGKYFLKLQWSITLFSTQLYSQLQCCAYILFSFTNCYESPAIEWRIYLGEG